MRPDRIRNTPVRTLLMPILAVSILHAQPPQQTDQGVEKIANVCPPEDVQALGLDCAEDNPCPVYLEVSSVDGFGASIFVTGNLHTVDTTLAGILLASTDGGKTWSEPAKRIRSAALQQIQFFDAQHGWVGGNLLDPLPRTPFLLSTADGGQSWHRTDLPGDPDYGSIQQFWFDSAQRGQLVVDRSQGATEKFELYSTSDGGETWTHKSSSAEAMHLPEAQPQADWRSVARKDSYEIQRRTAASWETVARFPTRAGECK
jgi:photosystem II stability/assembly factor-like uncharacterized protein